MINIKNIFVTTSISIFCGVYSLYNIIYYIQKVEMKHHNHVENLNKIIDDTYQKYENIKHEYLKMKDMIVTLNNKIIVLEDEINRQTIYNEQKGFINKYSKINCDYISSDTESLKLSEFTDTDNDNIVCDTLCKLNPDFPSIPNKISSNSLDTTFSDNFFNSNDIPTKDYDNNLNELNKLNELNELNEFNDMKLDNSIGKSYVFNSEESIKKLNEIFNDIGITLSNSKTNLNIETMSELDIITPPPSKNSSFCSLENYPRKRSLSVSEVNWMDITKKFIFG